MKKERDLQSPATVKDIESQNELMIEAMSTMIMKVTSDLKESNALLYADTQRRLIEFENSARNKFEDHEKRIAYLEQKDIAYIWIQKYGMKIFVGFCMFLFLLFLAIKSIFK